MTRSDLIDLAPPLERAFLIAVDTGHDEGWTAEDSLAELASLADTAGAEVVGAEWQHRRHIDPNWYLGKGKAEELRGRQGRRPASRSSSPTTSSRPTSRRPLEELLAVKVLDRSGLILDIFAQHAQTHEGRLQVELAQLEYQLPRLTRLWTHLSRTGGGIGTRGPGETQLETDRRVIRGRITQAQGARRAGPPAARDGGPLARPAPRAQRGHRGLHERRQVVAAQRADRARRPRAPRTGSSPRSTRPAARSSSATARASS